MTQPITHPLPDTRFSTAFVQALLTWFHKASRPLPWRTAYTPYHVWISEIMLQQTQMERGVQYFQRWMAALPNIAAVAAASEEQILRLWEGLGYYSRARNIHKAARIIMAEYGGIFPKTVAAIHALPGVGPYTAAAVASIAFQQDIPCIDANVERVLSRVFNIDTPVKTEPAKSYIHSLSNFLLPPGGARNYNQAMMELGALICGKKPHCNTCPLALYCQAYHLHIPTQRPVPVKKTKIHMVEAVTGILIHNGKVFIQKRPKHGLWGGLWEFPNDTVKTGEQPENAIIRAFLEKTGLNVRIQKKVTLIRHNYTTYRIRLHCFTLLLDQAKTIPNMPSPPALTAANTYQWVEEHALAQWPMPAAHRKFVDVYYK